MNIFNLNIKTLATILFILLTLYLTILISIYGLSHFEDSEINYIRENFKESIPNIYGCNFNYSSIKEHLDKEEFEHIRFRKIISTDEECFGKVAYTGFAPGTKFSLSQVLKQGMWWGAILYELVSAFWQNTE